LSKHKHLKFNIYFFIGLSVIITVFFTGVAINSVQNEKVKQQEIYQEKVSGLVESFQTSIENSMMAFEIISGLIEEKLLISSHILTEIPSP